MSAFFAAEAIASLTFALLKEANMSSDMVHMSVAPSSLVNQAHSVLLDVLTNYLDGTRQRLLVGQRRSYRPECDIRQKPSQPSPHIPSRRT